MKWQEIRNAYPQQWLIVEALQAHTEENHQRYLDRLAVVESCTDEPAALSCYRRLHQEYSSREFYFVHTSRTNLDIREQQWLGVRRNNAASIEK